MIQECSSAKGVCKIFRVNGIINVRLYMQIFLNRAKTSLKKLGVSIFCNGNDMKQTNKKLTKYLTETLQQ